jgi:CRP-like cAMP-binding protein
VAQFDMTRSGDLLFKLGDRNTDEGLFILEGAVKVTRANGDVRFLEAPDVLGEVQLFAPGAERTATVEVVYGGAVLRFSWRELGAKAKSIFSAAELAELRRAIRESADAREKNLLKSLEKGPRK